MANLAIIPARSGSKGLKDKNIRLLKDKPLIAYSIEAAMNSKLFDEIFVSTDSNEYADIAIQYGANVPFIRSLENSSDNASSWDVVRESLEMYKTIGQDFSMFCLLQPTTPLRTANDINNAYNIMIKQNANSVVSVCEMDHSPLWSNKLPEDHDMKDFIRDEIFNLPRQELDSFYRINGAIYMVKTDYFNECDSIYKHKCIAYIMDKIRSIDIDDEFDFNLCEYLISKV